MIRRVLGQADPAAHLSAVGKNPRLGPVRRTQGLTRGHPLQSDGGHVQGHHLEEIEELPIDAEVGLARHGGGLRQDLPGQPAELDATTGRQLDVDQEIAAKIVRVIESDDGLTVVQGLEVVAAAVAAAADLHLHPVIKLPRLYLTLVYRNISFWVCSFFFCVAHTGMYREAYRLLLYLQHHMSTWH